MLFFKLPGVVLQQFTMYALGLIYKLWYLENFAFVIQSLLQFLDINRRNNPDLHRPMPLENVGLQLRLCLTQFLDKPDLVNRSSSTTENSALNLQAPMNYT